MSFKENESTVRLRNPNFTPPPESSVSQLFGLDSNGPIGFAERLNIIQPSDFDDEPTIPWGLCQEDGYESAECLVVEEVNLVTEQDIIDDQDVEDFVNTMNAEYDLDALLREFLVD